MKLDIETINFIKKVVNTAKIVGIDNIIIEKDKVRGMDDHRTVVIFQPDIDELSCGSLGLNRTDVFMTRLELVNTSEGFKVVADIDEEREFVRGLKMSAKGTRIDYRCANPATIQAPKIINDTIVGTIETTEDAVTLLQKGAVAMGNAELVKIISDNDGVSFELEDVNNDTLKHEFAEGIDHKFSHKYPVKTLLALLKNKQDALEFDIGEKGIIRFDIRGLGVYVLPKV